MPRYFFNIVDGTSDRDLMGTELPDLHTAQAQAIRTTGEILRDMDAQLWARTEWKLEVADELGQVLFVLQILRDKRLSPPDSGPGLEFGPVPVSGPAKG